jgi:uncharacterized protein
MKLAVNYSPALADHLHGGRVQVDLVKSADFPEMVTAALALGPTCVHFGLESGNHSRADLDVVAVLADQTGTRHINTHLVCRGRGQSQGWPQREDDSPAAAAMVTESVVRDLQPLTSRFGADRVLIENLIYHGPGAAAGWAEGSSRGGGGSGVGGPEDWCIAGVLPAVFKEVIRQSAVGLLLDVSHARIACHYAGWNIWDYLGQMPVHAMRELHITGLAMHNGLLTDHMPMTEADWAFAGEVFARIRHGDWPRPAVVALEYGGTGPPFAWRTDPHVLVRDVPRLAEMMAAV